MTKGMVEFQDDWRRAGTLYPLKCRMGIPHPIDVDEFLADGTRLENETAPNATASKLLGDLERLGGHERLKFAEMLQTLLELPSGDGGGAPKAEETEYRLEVPVDLIDIARWLPRRWLCGPRLHH